jgi:hypothetical protein
LYAQLDRDSLRGDTPFEQAVQARRLDEVGRGRSPVTLTDAEEGTILGTRWWSPEEVAAHAGRFFPRSLPSLLPRLLAGERVEEPYDDWDLPDPA